MPAWRRLGTRDELLAQVPYSVKLDRQQIALFHYEGGFRAIGDSCNHKGGPLSQGHVNGEFVMCPWHAWEYSLLTGRGPAGYEEEAVPSFTVEERSDGVYIDTTPATPRRLVRHEPHPLLHPEPKPAGAPPRVFGLSTTAMDRGNPRYSTSDALLETAMAHARDNLGAETRLIRLSDLSFRPCEGNYSKAARACTWPCAITERDPADQLTGVYEALVNWADVILLTTPIRWGMASSLYHRFAERLNCVQNQVTISNKVLIRNKVAVFIITGRVWGAYFIVGGILILAGAFCWVMRSPRGDEPTS